MGGRQDGQVFHFQLDAKLTTCRCPRCGKWHQLKINWAGRGMPIKLCHNCNLCGHVDLNDDSPSVVKPLKYLEQPTKIWHKCACHGKYVFACPSFKAKWDSYLFLRRAEVASLHMDTVGV